MLYFRLSLFLPYLVSAIAWFLSVELKIENAFLWLTMLSMLFGGIPYTVFIVAILWFSRRFSDEKIQVLMAIMPLLFPPFLTLFLFFMEGSLDSEMLPFYVYIYAYALVFGYGYMLLITLGWGIIKILGLATRTEN